MILTFGSMLPGQLTDPLEHLWIMRWTQSCLTEGRSPFFCPDLNAPTGVPLGFFPTMHLQTAAYLALGLVTSNDVSRFNTLWFFGFVATGVGTFVLCCWTTRQPWPSWVAGLGAMLCGPMLMHAHGHLETMQMGAVPLFLIGWLRFVEEPGWRRLGISLGLYWLVVACAPYFAVLAVFPAMVAAVWSWSISVDRRGWLKARAGWFLGFALLALPGLAILFSSQIWAVVHGFSMARTRSSFNRFGAPIWSSFVPSPLHRLGQMGIPDFFEVSGYRSRMSECSSYLGVVTLALIAYAALFRVSFARRSFWWSSLIVLVVLSWGSHFEVSSTRISLPAGWIYNIFPPFQLIRVPARFNLFVAVCAAVPAAAALGDLLGKIRCSHRRITLAITLALVMIADLSMVPFQTSVIPPIPAAYRELSERKPASRIVDAPMFGSNHGEVFSSLWGYWQSFHHLQTTAAYPGVPNVVFDSEIVRSSPFWADRLVDPDERTAWESGQFGAASGVNTRDYAWLYLTAHKFDHVVWHQGQWFDPKYDAGSRQVRKLLEGARFHEDSDVAVYSRDRIPPPERLTWLCGEGFRPALSRSEPWSFGVLREGRLVIYQPVENQPVVIRLVDASAFRHRRIVRLIEGERELTHWDMEPDRSLTALTQPLLFPPGVHELRLISDSDDRPDRSSDKLDEGRTAYSWRLNSVRVEVADLNHP